MNILFYVSCTPDPLNGGIERVSYILASEFKKYGYKNYCIYYSELNPDYKSDVYEKTYYIPYTINDLQSRIKDILEKHHIDIVMNQLAYIWPINNAFYDIKKEINFKLLTVHHNNPVENHYIIENRIRQSKNNLKGIIRYFAYKIFPFIIHKRINIANHRQLMVDITNSNFYICLSHSFIENIQKQYYIAPSNKFKSIPNPLTFNIFFNIKNYNQKEKIVLFVGRYDETQKRVSKMLYIWKEIESQNLFNDWKFILVGHGPDQKLYEQLIKKLNLKHIELHGKNNPQPYYVRASIFLMTSAYEGWGMTLTESMQYGNVPIVYNTYSAVTDIIDNEKNGYIVEDNNQTKFIEKLKHLMNNDAVRKQMAEQAIEKVKSFTAPVIAKKWIDLFNAQ